MIFGFIDGLGSMLNDTITMQDILHRTTRGNKKINIFAHTSGRSQTFFISHIMIVKGSNIQTINYSDYSYSQNDMMFYVDVPNLMPDPSDTDASYKCIVEMIFTKPRLPFIQIPTFST